MFLISLDVTSGALVQHFRWRLMYSVQWEIDICAYIKETITKIRCFSRENCKCQLCLVIGALCVETVVRRTPMPRFTPFHTLTFISSNKTYSKGKEYRFKCLATSYGFFNELEALIPRHKSHILMLKLRGPQKEHLKSLQVHVFIAS